MKTTNTKASLILLFFFILNSFSFTQSLVDQMPITDGPIDAIVNDGSAIYIGGHFSYVGPNTGGGASVDLSTSSVNSSTPRVDGTVYVAVPDGTGGWYIGGSFDLVGGILAQNIAHIKSDFSVDPNWNPYTTSALGTVYSMALSGSILYIGGQFTHVDGQSRTNLAAINISDGTVTSWDPETDSGIYTQVLSLAVSGSTIFAGGSFTAIGGAAINRFAAIDASTGTAVSRTPDVSSTVRAIAVSGSTVYIGGDFTLVGGLTRNHIAAIDISTESVSSWDANADGLVLALAGSGSIIYAGGSFTSIGGQTRNNIAALSASSGTATSWDPNANYQINSMSLSGSTIYVCGAFSTIGGQTRDNVAGIDLSSTSINSFNVYNNTFYTGFALKCISVSGSSVFIGGSFTSIGGLPRNNLAAINAATGNIKTWDPEPDADVYSLVISGSTLYVGGAFNNIGLTARNYLASFNISTGSLTTWDPEPDDYVETFAISGSNLYAGGNFSSMNGGSDTRNYLASFDISTGNLTTWDPEPDGEIFKLASSGTTLYAGGNFSNIASNPRNYLASFDVSTGGLTSWDPEPDNTVQAFAISGSTLYVGGAFNNIGSTARNYLAAFDTSIGNITTWDPGSDDLINTLAVSGSLVYAGGNFTLIGGQSRSKLAALDASTGSATTWNPDVLNGNVFDISIDLTNGRIYAGGSLSGVSGVNTADYFVGLTDNGNSALPVELSSFSASVNSQSIKLKWNTATEVNNFGFEIQRENDDQNPDGNTWGKVGFVKGAGNSNSPKQYSFIDEPSQGHMFKYRLKQIDNDGKFTYSNVISISISSPEKFTLEQNYPNPFNPSTKIKYSISNEGTSLMKFVQLKVYDILGREVATLVNKEQPPGNYQVSFDGSKLSSGVYYYRIQAGNFIQTKKMILMK